MNSIEIIQANYAKATQGIKGQWLDDVSFEWYNYVVGLPLELKVTYLVVISCVFEGQECIVVEECQKK